MNRCWCLLACLILAAAPASAQGRFYFGGTVAADAGDRGPALNSLGTIPAAGGLIGWRFNDGWSIEVHIDRGFKEGTPHFRLGHFGSDRLDDRAGEGWGVFATWKSRPVGRVSFAALMGLSERRFETDLTVGTDRAVNLPPPDNVLLQGQTDTTSAAGPTAGFLLPISLGGGWSVAPEVRFSMAFTSEGIYGDGLYGRWYSGARVMWGF